MLAKTDHPQFAKDTSNNALVNRDTSAFIAYRRQKDTLRNQKACLNNLEERMNGLEDKLDLILSLLKK